MTLDEFITKLATSGRTWQLNSAVFANKRQRNLLRSPSRHCPITGVAETAGMLMEMRDCLPGYFPEAGTFLRMRVADVDKIVDAADDQPKCDKALRQRLLEACNLVVPEITSVEQVNACKLECAT